MARPQELVGSLVSLASWGGRGGEREMAGSEGGVRGWASSVWGRGAVPVGWQTSIGGEGARE